MASILVVRSKIDVRLNLTVVPVGHIVDRSNRGLEVTKLEGGLSYDSEFDFHGFEDDRDDLSAQLLACLDKADEATYRCFKRHSRYNMFVDVQTEFGRKL